MLRKIRDLRARIAELGLSTKIEIDGGVSSENLEEVAATGVDRIVSGSAIFGSGDVRGTTETFVRRLTALAEREHC